MGAWSLVCRTLHVTDDSARRPASYASSPALSQDSYNMRLPIWSLKRLFIFHLLWSAVSATPPPPPLRRRSLAAVVRGRVIELTCFGVELVCASRDRGGARVFFGLQSRCKRGRDWVVGEREIVGSGRPCLGVYSRGEVGACSSAGRRQRSGGWAARPVACSASQPSRARLPVLEGWVTATERVASSAGVARGASSSECHRVGPALARAETLAQHAATQPVGVTSRNECTCECAPGLQAVATRGRGGRPAAAH